MNALWWINTEEGVSDLRRFWNGRSADFTIEEIIAFMNTLPDDSSTNRSMSDSEVSVQTLLIASQLDILRQIGSGMGGKKFPKRNLIAPQFSKEIKRDKEKRDGLVEKLKKQRQDEENQ